MPHSNMLVRKLEGFAPLPEADRQLVKKMTEGGRHVSARSDIISEGENPDNVHLILSGYACRYKMLPGGGRQIMALFLPGDFCDLFIFILKEMDHSISTLTDCHVVDMPKEDVLSMLEKPALARALWWSTLVDEAILRERIVDIGRRPALERVAHLLCECVTRLKAVGLTDGKSFTLNITQTDIADALGLTNVYVNKVMMDLKQRDILTMHNSHVDILNPGALMRIGDFSSNYLHLNA